MNIRLNNYSVLIYEVVDDYADKRTPHREDHVALAAEYAGRGEFVMGGAVGDPPDRAFLVFAGDRSLAESFVARDPYVAAGLVLRWDVQPWACVLGDDLKGSA